MFSGEYSIEECDDGAEALGRAICRPPSLIVMETRIRRIDGVTLAKLLRADAATRLIPIVVVTAANTADRVRAMRAGASAVVGKPFQLDEIITTVRNLLDGSARLDTDAQAETVSDSQGPDPTERSGSPRRAMSHALHRHRTTSPQLTPPPLRCPRCDANLVFQHSYVGGVNHRSTEQWDYLACSRCGTFQYRHRTRALKPVR
jgi:CheY-like chemotaxis protein